MSALLEIQRVSKQYGETKALDDASFSVDKGCFFGLLGPNGAGKSTLMHILSTFIEADSGTVLIDGQTVDKGNPDSRQKIGLVTQELALYQRISCLQNLKIFGELYQLPSETIRERSEELLKAVDLWDRRNDKVKDFSGGMKRRLNLVIGLMHRPEILLCDEPTVGVDPQSRNAIFEFLQKLHADGLTVIYTSHYMEEIERLCERIGVIDHGQMKAIGSLDELLALSPTGQQIILPAELEKQVIGKLGGTLQIKHDADRILLEPSTDIPLSSIIRDLEGMEIPMESLRVRPPTLESVFLELTGRSLRD